MRVVLKFKYYELSILRCQHFSFNTCRVNVDSRHCYRLYADERMLQLIRLGALCMSQTGKGSLQGMVRLDLTI